MSPFPDLLLPRSATEKRQIKAKFTLEQQSPDSSHTEYSDSLSWFTIHGTCIRIPTKFTLHFESEDKWLRGKAIAH